MGMNKSVDKHKMKKLLPNMCISAVSLLLAAGGLAAQADTKPCIIARGDGVADHNADLAQFNRIKFGPESMTLTNSDDPTVSHELPYSQFNRIMVGEAEPTAAIKEIIENATSTDTLLSYDKAAQTLSASAPVAVVVFNAAGVKQLVGKLAEGEPLSVASLHGGIYIAVTNTGHTLKFIK